MHTRALSIRLNAFGCVSIRVLWKIAITPNLKCFNNYEYTNEPIVTGSLGFCTARRNNRLFGVRTKPGTRYGALFCFAIPFVGTRDDRREVCVSGASQTGHSSWRSLRRRLGQPRVVCRIGAEDDVKTGPGSNVRGDGTIRIEKENAFCQRVQVKIQNVFKSVSWSQSLGRLG